MRGIWLTLFLGMLIVAGCFCGIPFPAADVSAGDTVAAPRARIDALSDSALAMFLPTGFALNAFETAALTGGRQAEYLLISRSRARGETAAELPTVVTIVAWTETAGWHELAEMNYSPEEELVIRTGMLVDSRDAVVIGTRAGSGSYFTYRVLGCPRAHPVELLTRSNLFQGDAEIRGGMLYEYSGSAVRVFRWDGSRLSEPAGAPKRLPDEQAGDRIIAYHGRRAGGTDLSTDTVVLDRGQRLRLRRAVNDPFSGADRMLYEDNGVLQMRDRFLVAVRPGCTNITVIPNGYDDTAVIVPVVVH